MLDDSDILAVDIGTMVGHVETPGETVSATVVDIMLHHVNAKHNKPFTIVDSYWSMCFERHVSRKELHLLSKCFPNDDGKPAAMGAFFKGHFILVFFGRTPGVLEFQDSLREYYAAERNILLTNIADFHSLNLSEHLVPQQAPGSNDCWLHVINNFDAACSAQMHQAPQPWTRQSVAQFLRANPQLFDRNKV